MMKLFKCNISPNNSACERFEVLIKCVILLEGYFLSHLSMCSTILSKRMCLITVAYHCSFYVSGKYEVDSEQVILVLSCCTVILSRYWRGLCQRINLRVRKRVWNALVGSNTRRYIRTSGFVNGGLHLSCQQNSSARRVSHVMFTCWDTTDAQRPLVQNYFGCVFVYAIREIINVGVQQEIRKRND